MIVKDTTTKKYQLICKGADSVMLDRIKFENNRKLKNLFEIVEEDLYTYSVEGLRTLIIAQRAISKEEYGTFKKVYKHLQV